MSTGPVESKVKAATFGAAVAGLAIWTLETYVFKGVVPVPVQAVLDIAIPAIVAFAAGFTAKHTFRRDPDALKTAPTTPPPSAA